MNSNQTFALETLKLTVPSVVAITILIIGYFFTRASDRRKWVNESRKTEYRELLSGMAIAFDSILRRNSINDGRKYDLTPERLRQLNEEIDNCDRLFNDRLFIAQEIEAMKLYERWTKSRAAYHGTREDGVEFLERFKEIRNDMVAEAQRQK